MKHTKFTIGLTFTLMLTMLAFVLKAQKTIRGTVYNESHHPIPGVNVVQKGTVNGTVSSTDGSYVFQVQNDSTVLAFSFIGYEKQEVKVKNSTIIDIVLVPSACELSDIVVIGYGTQKK